VTGKEGIPEIRKHDAESEGDEEQQRGLRGTRRLGRGTRVRVRDVRRAC
jgi:hypothetical protein